MEFGSAEQYNKPTFFASGNSSFNIAACWSSGARSEVTKKYNKANCEALGITVPDDYVVIEE